MSPASASAASRLDGSALPLPAISSAVPWSGEVRMKGSPSVTLTPCVEVDGLERDQRLVVIHAEHRVVARRAAASWKRVSAGSRASGRDAVGAQRGDGGCDDVDLLATERAVLRRHAG